MNFSKTRFRDVLFSRGILRNSTQLSQSDEVKGSAESWGRAGVDAVESGSLSQMGEGLWAEKCFLGEKPLNRPDRANG